MSGDSRGPVGPATVGTEQECFICQREFCWQPSWGPLTRTLERKLLYTLHGAYLALITSKKELLKLSYGFLFSLDQFKPYSLYLVVVSGLFSP